jgi:predicted PhzF superfamily epimerase YddE/YHI9
MLALHVVRVFCSADGRHGNPLGVFLDGPAIQTPHRQAVAARLGFSETVFVDDAVAGVVDIRTPTTALPFAGHPLVGTAWLLEQRGTPVDVLRPPAGVVATWRADDGVRWIRGRAEWAPPMELRRYASPADVDALAAPPDGADFVDCWAWADEALAIVRSRVFAPAFGIDEDEATGAAAVRLVTHLGRPVTIRQGVGSLIHARPGPGGSAEIGGRVVAVEARQDPGR